MGKGRRPERLAAGRSASPFPADCGLTAEGGTLVVDSEVEPYVDVSPVDQDIVAGIWQQDRWSNGGARGNVAAISFDGGATWDQTTFPGITECTGGEFDRASDPWLSFSSNGDLHVMHLVLDISPPEGRPGGFGANGMVVQKVTAAQLADGDIDPSEWSDPIELAVATDGNLHDKNSLTADPTDSNFVYAVWDFLDIPAGGLIRPDRAVALGFKGAALISRTTDGGETWSEPEVLYNPGGINQTIGNQIVVDDQGVVYDFFNEILNFRNDDGGSRFDFNLAFKFSNDKGDDDGTVGVNYYDFRNNAAGGGSDADHWLVHCHDGCSNPANWAGNENHVDGSFDVQGLPFAGGFFPGDYVGLSNQGDAFVPFFTQSTPTDPANQFFATVTP